MKSAVLLVVLIAVLLVAGCTSQGAGQTSKKTNVSTPANLTEEQQPPETPTEQPAPSGTDCGTSTVSKSSPTSTAWDCFIAASTNCDIASVTSALTLGPQTSTAYYEIRGLDADGKCILYMRHIRDSIAFPSGTSQEIISQVNAQYKAFEGKESTCAYDTADLTAMLNRWGTGSFSTNDLTAANCHGSYFDAISG
jgi:hypothetical protein